MSSSGRLLLLSNSTMCGTEYMSWSKGMITTFLTNKVKEILFIPFAAITLTWDDYRNTVQTALPDFVINSIHNSDNQLESIAKSEAIMIGGGNTFQLLYKLQELNLIEPIRDRVLNGIPYIGWSAGSNVAGPDIGTTNDMPVIWPKTDRALNLVPFNLNPHFNEWKPSGYQGEGRAARLDECILIKKRPIVALSEGTAIEVENQKHTIVAPELNSGNTDRCVKIWLFNEKKDKNIEVIDVSFGTDITPIVTQNK